MGGRSVFLAHPSSLDHDPGPHPEQPARIRAIEAELEARDWLGYTRMQSPAAERAVVEAVHPRRQVQALADLSAAGGGYVDLDTAMSPGSFQAALHGAGGAVRLAEMLVTGEAAVGFSAHRPPGHHALPLRAMGFCLFNNVAVAARHALDTLELERVLVLDWDVHHGNGTNDIFHATEEVLFVSIHQSPLYPGTGAASDAGSGPGEGFTVNLPVPAGSGDGEYAALMEQVVVPLTWAYAPQLVLISAGYDAHVEDPLAGCELSEEGFAGMSRAMAAVCREVGAPLGCVLEGGYALGALARSVAVTMEAIAAPGFPSASAREVAGAPAPATACSEAARARLARWWRL